MSDVGAGVLAERRVVPEDVIALWVFSVCLFWLVRTVVCSGIHFRRVLSGMEGRLGQRMLCQMIGTTDVC